MTSASDSLKIVALVNRWEGCPAFQHHGGDIMVDPALRVQKLIQRLQSPNYLVRLHAGCLLGQMGEAGKEAVPTLLELLRSGDTADRKLAVWALGYLGRGASEATTALLAALRDSDESVRMLATSALEKIAAARPAAAAA